MCARVLSHFSCVWLLTTLRTLSSQAPLSRVFSRREYWSGLPCPPLGDFPNPEIESMSHALAGGFFTASALWEAPKLPYGSTIPLLGIYPEKTIIQKYTCIPMFIAALFITIQFGAKVTVVLHCWYLLFDIGMHF